jgi:hypothetical protein
MQGEFKVTLTFENPLANFFADKILSVPLSQVMLYEVIINLCMLLRRHKMGLFISCTIFFLELILNKPNIIDLLRKDKMGLYVYTIFGVGRLYCQSLKCAKKVDPLPGAYKAILFTRKGINSCVCIKADQYKQTSQ